MTKTFVAGAGALLALILFASTRLRAQKLSAPKTLLLPLAWLVPLAYLLSTLFQTNPTVTFYGETLAVDSLAFMLSGAVLLTVTALTLTTRERMLSLYLALLGGAGMVALFELLIFFARSLVTGTSFVVPVPSVVGSLNDLALFSGLVTVLSLTTLATLTLTKVSRVVVWAALVLSVAFLAVVNLKLLWWLVGGYALAMFVYSMYQQFMKAEQSSEEGMKLSGASLVVLAIALLMLFGGESVSGAPARWANVGELDVRPSWSATLAIGKSTLASNPFFGSGPGTFSHEWSQRRPLDVNETVFWNADFVSAIGFVPTSIISTGILGALAWLAFFIMLCVVGFRLFVLDKDRTDPLTFYIRISSWVGAVYLWLIAIITAPSPALIGYAFLMTGLFVATLGLNTRPVELVFKSVPKLGFVATLVLTVAFLSGVAGIAGYGSRYLAETSFQKAVLTYSSTGNLDETERLITRALAYNEVDTYRRLLAELYLRRMQELVTSGKPPEEIREQFQQLLGAAVTHAQSATTLDGRDYQNWVALGNVYQNVVPLGIEGAYDSAMDAFNKALERRPNGPGIILSKAALERLVGKPVEAKAFAEEAIRVRSRYTDAILLLAQLQIEEGNVDEAVRSVEAAAILDPNNPVTFFQLGLLRYSKNDFAGAAGALERAVALNDVYANARYFLGLSYYRMGGLNERAIEQFEKVQSTNPESEDVKSILANLRAGKPPYGEATPAPAEEIKARELAPLNEQEGRMDQ